MRQVAACSQQRAVSPCHPASSAVMLACSGQPARAPHQAARYLTLRSDCAICCCSSGHCGQGGAASAARQLPPVPSRCASSSSCTTGKWWPSAASARGLRGHTRDGLVSCGCPGSCFTFLWAQAASLRGAVCAEWGHSCTSPRRGLPALCAVQGIDVCAPRGAQQLPADFKVPMCGGHVQRSGTVRPCRPGRRSGTLRQCTSHSAA